MSRDLNANINPNWFLRMFGPFIKRVLKSNIDQTFYGEHLKLYGLGEQEYGPTPMVVHITSREPQPQIDDE